MSDLERIELPSGGWVEFKDLDEMTGKEFIRVKSAMHADMIQTIALMQRELAKILISAWNIPGQPNLPIPSSKKGQFSYEQLAWKDLRLIEATMSSHVARIISDEEDEDEGKDDAPSGATPDTD